MNNVPEINKPAKSTRNNSSKTKKPKMATKSKKTKSAKITTISNADTASITQSQRQTMIQEMAYLIAERRGFSEGSNPTEDWLQAENKVDARLLSRATEG